MWESLQEFFGNPYVLIVLLTFAPFLELRASIPYGLIKLGNAQWLPVLAIAVATNILLGPILYVGIDKFMHVLLRIKWFERLWTRQVAKTQKKLHPYIHKYGVWGLSVFIGIPLPGSGVYSGAIGAYVFGFSFREFLVSTILGVLIAATIVTIVVLTGSSTFDFMLKH